MRARNSGLRDMERQFPFLFGGTFIEGQIIQLMNTNDGHFPCFSEGLSLRVRFAEHALTSQRRFPFLFGGTFIEGLLSLISLSLRRRISLPFGRDFH